MLVIKLGLISRFVFKKNPWDAMFGVAIKHPISKSLGLSLDSTYEYSFPVMCTLGGSTCWFMYVGPCYSCQETQFEFLAPGFELTQPWLLWTVE